MAAITELFQRAVNLHQSGDLAQADILYRQILQTDSIHAETHHFLGVLEQQVGHHEAAIVLIRRAIELAPANAAYQFSLGTILVGQGNLNEAADCFRLALRLQPDHPQAYVSLGTILQDQGKPLEAMECYRQALRINPQNESALHNLGTTHLHHRQFAEAADCFRQALRIQPDNAKTHINLGNALKEQGRLAEAADCFRQALRINPDYTEALNNLGNIRVGQGLLDEGADCFRQALALDPGNAMTLWNQALLRLAREDFPDAWRDYEIRWALPHWPPPAFHGPRWDGSSLLGKTILVFHEQALGDMIQFVRYLPLVKERGGTVLFACQPALRQLLAGVAGVDQFVDEGQPTPAHDVQIPLLSVPGIFQTTLATIPAAVPYLAADRKLIEHWGREIAGNTAAAFGSPLNIGIAWQGNPKIGGDRLRSIPLEQFEPLGRLPGVRLISLQKRPGAEQIGALRGRFPILDLSDRLEDLQDTAAVMKNLDLVVSSDTAVAHLAGALGVPVWIALQLVPDWRWFLGRSDSPWYPTMRLFRQNRLGDWSDVFKRIAAEIQSRFVY